MIENFFSAEDTKGAATNRIGIILFLVIETANCNRLCSNSTLSLYCAAKCNEYVSKCKELEKEELYFSQNADGL